MSEHYYESKHLGAFGDIAEGAPDLAKKFFEYYNAVFAAGALTEREKALIALAVAHAVQCPYCIDAYTTEVVGKKAGKPSITYRRVVSKDGKTLTLRATGTDAKGEKVNEVAVFDKQ